MTETEYKKRMEEIEEAYNKAKRSLYIECAASNRKFKVGDIISDGSVTILIEKFGTSVTFGMPEPIYIGKELKKDLTPKKNGVTSTIFGNSMTKLIKAV